MISCLALLKLNIRGGKIIVKLLNVFANRKLSLGCFPSGRQLEKNYYKCVLLLVNQSGSFRTEITPSLHHQKPPLHVTQSNHGQFMSGLF